MTGDTSTGWTDLHYAAAHGDQKPGAIQSAIASGCALEAKASDGQTALHKAVRFGQASAVRELLAAGASTAAVDGDTQTPLHLAACYNTAATVPPLLASGADREARDRWAWTPIFWAVYRDYDAVFVLLRDGGAKMGPGLVDHDSMTLLHWAVKAGALKILRLLLTACPSLSLEDRDKWGWTPIFWAVYRDYDSMFILLRDAGAKASGLVDNDSMTLLHWAVKAGAAKALRLLLGAGPKVSLENRDKWGWTPIFWAVYRDEDAIFTLLRDIGARTASDLVDKDGMTLLHWAGKAGALKVLRLLLDTSPKPSLEDKDKWGWTPIFWAVYRDNDAAFTLLRDGGAKTDLVDKEGMTLLHWAGKAGAVKVLQLMLDASPTPWLENKDKWGWTPLLWAAYRDEAGVLGLLLDYEANRNVADPDGRTALSWAAGAGKVEAVKVLLARRAKTDLKDNHGKTAKDWAATDEIKALLG